MLRRLTVEKELAVLFVSHRMREIRQIAARLHDHSERSDRRRPGALTSITDAEIVDQMGQAAWSQRRRPPPDQPRGERQPGTQAGTPNTLRIQTEGIDLSRRSAPLSGLPGAACRAGGANGRPHRRLVDRCCVIARDGRERCLSAALVRAARDGVGFVSGDRANKGILANLPIIDNLAASARVIGRRTHRARRRK